MAKQGFSEQVDPTGLGFLEYLTEGVLILDQQRSIKAINSAMTRLTGWSAEELIGKQCSQFFCCQHPGTATFLCDNLCPMISLLSSKNPVDSVSYQDISILTKSGERLSISASYAPLELPPVLIQTPNSVVRTLSDDQVTGIKSESFIIVVLRDITEHVRQEKLKVDFIATASHQLRTPLSSIKTSIGLLLDNIGPNFNPPLLRLLHNIQGSSLRLERLVNDLIELTRLQSGRVNMQYQRIEVMHLIEKSVELSRDFLKLKQQRLKLSLPANNYYVEVDYGRICQVLQHLLSNASKFSPEGSCIELEVTTKLDHNRKLGDYTEVIFSVRDEGIGIPSEEYELVFEKFYQGPLIENNNEFGTGLGLPLAKVLVELNGGHLWFESEVDKGSVFHFSFPAVDRVPNPSYQ
ncbi:MAG TPA: ATP-binding protein [Chloroflexia bacterium]|nr:ATP-binding protein [Chloroflexia bacterium]